MIGIPKRRTGPSLGALVSVAAIVILPATIGVARAGDFCSNIDQLMDQSRSGFTDILEKPAGGAGDQPVTLGLAGASNCFVTKRSNGSSYQCTWDFPHRAQRAYDRFEALARELDRCIGQRATLHSDRNVNHPDYYALRRYETARAAVSVSVKDKSALGKTFVFVRVQGGKGN